MFWAFLKLQNFFEVSQFFEVLLDFLFPQLSWLFWFYSILNKFQTMLDCVLWTFLQNFQTFHPLKHLLSLHSHNIETTLELKWIFKMRFTITTFFSTSLHLNSSSRSMNKRFSSSSPCTLLPAYIFLVLALVPRMLERKKHCHLSSLVFSSV